MALFREALPGAGMCKKTVGGCCDYRNIGEGDTVLTEELTVHHKMPVASACHPPYGIYIPSGACEREGYLGQLDARIKALFRRSRGAVKRPPAAEVVGQMEFEFLKKKSMGNIKTSNKLIKDCTKCKFWRMRNSRVIGVRIPRGYGKCARPQGHCDPSQVNTGF